MAYSDTPLGINNNPAGIARVHHSEIQFALEPHILMGTRYKGSSGDNISTPFDIFCAAPSITYNVNNQLRLTESTSYAEAGQELFAKPHVPRSTQAAQIDKIYADGNAGGEGNFSKSIAAIYQSNKASPVYSGAPHTGNAAHPNNLPHKQPWG